MAVSYLYLLGFFFFFFFKKCFYTDNELQKEHKSPLLPWTQFAAMLTPFLTQVHYQNQAIDILEQ